MFLNKSVKAVMFAALCTMPAVWAMEQSHSDKVLDTFWEKRQKEKRVKATLAKLEEVEAAEPKTSMAQEYPAMANFLRLRLRPNTNKKTLQKAKAAANEERITKMCDANNIAMLAEKKRNHYKVLAKKQMKLHNKKVSLHCDAINAQDSAKALENSSSLKVKMALGALSSIPATYMCKKNNQWAPSYGVGFALGSVICLPLFFAVDKCLDAIFPTFTTSRETPNAKQQKLENQLKLVQAKLDAYETEAFWRKLDADKKMLAKERMRSSHWYGLSKYSQYSNIGK